MLYRLAPDYQCHPVWAGEGDDYRNVCPSELPVSDALREAIDTWDRQYQDTYSKTDPASSSFVSDLHEREFDKAGRALWRRLISELGPEHDVTYFSVLTGWEAE